MGSTKSAGVAGVTPESLSSIACRRAGYHAVYAEDMGGMPDSITYSSKSAQSERIYPVRGVVHAADGQHLGEAVTHTTESVGSGAGQLQRRSRSNYRGTKTMRRSTKLARYSSLLNGRNWA